jgi:hypothetical protein
VSVRLASEGEVVAVHKPRRSRAVGLGESLENCHEISQLEGHRRARRRGHRGHVAGDPLRLAGAAPVGEGRALDDAEPAPDLVA